VSDDAVLQQQTRQIIKVPKSKGKLILAHVRDSDFANVPQDSINTVVMFRSGLGNISID